MPDGVIYFPYMRAPSAAWFTRVLLYWDRIGTIVPNSYQTDPDAVGVYGLSLIREGLLATISPDDHDTPDLVAGFDQVLRAASIRPRSRRSNAKADTTQLTRIHLSKLGLSLARDLEGRGLARPANGTASRPFWYDVEPSVANLFMAYLAAVLGTIDGLSPITDDREAISALAGLPSGFATSLQEVDRLQLGFIESILPAPEEPVPAVELRRFKEDHRELLTRLRFRVENAALDVAGLADAELLARRVQLRRGELQADLDAVCDLMNRRDWPQVVFGAWGALVSAGASLGIAVTTAHPAPALIAAGAGFASALYQARGIANADERALRAPLAYAALANAAFAGRRQGALHGR